MDCPAVTTLEQAEAKLPSSVLPISGLRRGEDGTLTDDAKLTVMDGLKSRGTDPTDPETKQRIQKELASLLCSTNQQYQYLLNELYRRVSAHEPIKDQFIDTIREKNLFMTDILVISRHIESLQTYDGNVPFIEGWQNTVPPSSPPATTTSLTQNLARDRAALNSRSYEDLRRHMVVITQEKNKVASNYLGLYGFLNLVAVGLIVYVAGIMK
jgi:hypothetical protein